MVANVEDVKDTSIVDRGFINLGWQMRLPTYEIRGNLETKKDERVRKDYDNVTGNAKIFWNEKIFDYFGIPEMTGTVASFTPSEKDFWSQGKDSVSQRFESIDPGASTFAVERKGGNRLQTQVKGANATSQLSLQVPLLESLTARGDYRRVSVRLPRFFNLVMATQALVQIFATGTKADRRPPFFWTSAGTMYELPYTDKIIQAKAVISPADCGAWLASTPIADTNSGKSTNVPKNVTVVGSGGSGKKGKPTA